MNTVDDLVESLTPDMVSNLKRAIEVGKFPDGLLVTAQQKELMLEAIIYYDALNLPEVDRTGFILQKKPRSGIYESVGDKIPSRSLDND